MTTKLTADDMKALDEMIEKHRAEGYDAICEASCDWEDATYPDGWPAAREATIYIKKKLGMFDSPTIPCEPREDRPEQGRSARLY